jgi:hypothetical protein
MKLKNTAAVKTALITNVFALLCALPDAVHETSAHDSAYAIGYWGFYLFFAVATVLGMIQLSSLRKQGKEFAERLKPGVDSVGAHAQFAAPLR